MTEMDVSDTARALGVSERTVRRWLREGRLAGYRIGLRIRIPEQSIRDAVAPYGAGQRSAARSSVHLDPLVAYLAGPERLRTRREAAARAMDAIALRSGPGARPGGPGVETAEPAEALIRGVRDDAEHRLDTARGRRRS